MRSIVSLTNAYIYGRFLGILSRRWLNVVQKALAEIQEDRNLVLALALCVLKNLLGLVQLFTPL